MHQQKTALGIVLFSTILITIAQILLKKGLQDFSLAFLLAHPFSTQALTLGGGIFLYGVSALLLIVALSLGELSILYPVYATSYVWVALLSLVYLHETITPAKLFGIGSILFGVFFLYFPGSHLSRKEKKHLGGNQ